MMNIPRVTKWGTFAMESRWVVLGSCGLWWTCESVNEQKRWLASTSWTGMLLPEQNRNHGRGCPR